jgi:hypothetical protein
MNKYEILTNLSVDEIINSILKIDNGYMDEWAEINQRYDYIEQMRYNLLDELIERYLRQKLVGEDNDLERAYKLFLRFYV